MDENDVSLDNKARISNLVVLTMATITLSREGYISWRIFVSSMTY